MTKLAIRVRLSILLIVALLAGAISLLAVSHSQASTAKYSVLFDNAHAETAGNADWIISTSQPDPLQENSSPQQEKDWTGGISAWGVALQKTGRYRLMTNTGVITYGDSGNPLDLSHFNAFVIPEPNVRFSSAEKTAILSWVKAGGGLFMIADHDGSDRNNDGYDSLRIFNDLMNNGGAGNDVFGIQFDVLNIQNENPNNDAPGNDPILNGPFGHATSSIIRNGTTETLNPSDDAAAKGVIYRAGHANTGTTAAFVSRSAYGSGRVVAIGDSSAIDDGTCAPGNKCYNGWNDPAGTDPALFLNATQWLAGGSGGQPIATQPPLPPAATSTPEATPAPDETPITGGDELIQNGDFESGSDPWQQSSSGGYQVVDKARAHQGSYSAYFCGYNNCADELYQTVTIPNGVSAASLSYYWYMSTKEKKHAYDYLYVRIRDTQGQTLTTLQRISDGSTAGGWQHASYDVSKFAGQTVQVAFVGTTDARFQTFFFVDDVSLQVQQ